MNKCFIVLQNKLLNFYFELKYGEWKIFPLLRYVSYLRVGCVVVTLTRVMGRIRASYQPRGHWREAYHLVNDRAPLGLCKCPSYCACQ